MNIRTVAVYSDADVNSLHVRMADEAVRIGPPPTNKSYLSIENIVGAVRSTGAQAVHPGMSYYNNNNNSLIGYGFLSENSKFVHALDEHGIKFIGPSEKSMAMMGNKIESKKIAKEAGVHTMY